MERDCIADVYREMYRGMVENDQALMDAALDEGVCSGAPERAPRTQGGIFERCENRPLEIQRRYA